MSVKNAIYDNKPLFSLLLQKHFLFKILSITPPPPLSIKTIIILVTVKIKKYLNYHAILTVFSLKRRISAFVEKPVFYMRHG
jgi:hypothetical protein